jgi:hypothetical protein
VLWVGALDAFVLGANGSGSVAVALLNTFDAGLVGLVARRQALGGAVLFAVEAFDTFVRLLIADRRCFGTLAAAG